MRRAAKIPFRKWDNLATHHTSLAGGDAIASNLDEWKPDKEKAVKNVINKASKTTIDDILIEESYRAPTPITPQRNVCWSRMRTSHTVESMTLLRDVQTLNGHFDMWYSWNVRR